MKNKSLLSRLIYLGFSTIAILILGISYIAKGKENEGYDSKRHEVYVGNKYTIKIGKQPVNEKLLYYPIFEDMADKDVLEKINEKIKNIKDAYYSMFKNDKLKEMDYEIHAKDDDIVSILFKGILIKDGYEVEIRKSLNIDVNTGSTLKLKDVIDKKVLESEKFIKLIQDKLNMISLKVNNNNLDELNFYINIKPMLKEYVFYFLENNDDKEYSEIRINESEIFKLEDELNND